MFIPLTPDQADTLAKITDYAPRAQVFLDVNGSGPEDTHALGVVVKHHESGKLLEMEVDTDGDLFPSPFPRWYDKLND
jgi:hypothetical protein